MKVNKGVGLYQRWTKVYERRCAVWKISERKGKEKERIIIIIVIIVIIIIFLSSSYYLFLEPEKGWLDDERCKNVLYERQKVILRMKC